MRKQEQSKIPSDVDWGEYWSNPETDYAYEKSGGKTIEEVLPYFEDAVLGASECISHMPDVPFA